MYTLQKFALVLSVLAFLGGSASAQRPKTKEPSATPASSAPAAPSAGDAHVRSSAAYAEVVLRQTELSAQLDALLEEYTENYPKVIETRLQLASINADLPRLFAVKPEDAGKLTAALGRLIVRRSELFSEYKTAERQYDADNPIVRRAKKAYESFSKSIDEILR